MDELKGIFEHFVPLICKATPILKYIGQYVEKINKIVVFRILLSGQRPVLDRQL